MRLTFFCVLLLCFGAALFADRATLHVTVRGIRGEVGALSYLVFDEEGVFPQHRETAVAGGIADIDGKAVEFSVAGLPFGRYAISILHDEDGDLQMKTGLFGIPREGFGFSNDAPLRFGPPKFEDAAILVFEPVHRVTITIRYR